MVSSAGVPVRFGAGLALESDEWLHSAISRWAWQSFGVSRWAMFDAFGLLDVPATQIESSGNVLLPHIVKNIAFSTGLSEARLHQATMASLHGNALHIKARQVDRSGPWSRLAGTRYCPACLRESPGVFKVRWRLAWTFACVEHQQVLFDNCAGCHREVVEMRGRNTDPFDPSTCRSDTARSRGNRRVPCRHRLSDSPGDMILDSSSEVLAAQVAIDAALDGGDGLELIRNLQSIATGLRGANSLDMIASLSGIDEPELRGLFDEEKHVGISAPKNALAMGALVAAARALDRLGESTVASRIIRRATFERPPARVPRDAGYGPGSPRELLTRWGDPPQQLRGRILRALDEDLTISQRILWDTAASRIVRQSRAVSNSEQRCFSRSNLPMVLWSDWTARMDLEGQVEGEFLAMALRKAVVNVGIEEKEVSGRALADVLRPNMLGTPEENSLLMKAISHLHAAVQCSARRIDYTQRSRIAYATMLSYEHWLALTGGVEDAPPGSRPHRNAQRFLAQRITNSGNAGLPTRLKVGVEDNDTYDYSIYRISMTTERLDAFDEHAAALLRRLGIDEPVRWSPDPIEEQQWPGREIDDLDLPRMHALLLNGLRSRSRLATELGTSERRVMWAIEAFPPSDGSRIPAVDWDTVLSTDGQSTAAR